MKLREIKIIKDYEAIVESMLSAEPLTEGIFDPTRGYGSWLPADPSRPTYFVEGPMGHSGVAEKLAIEAGVFSSSLPLYTFMFLNGYIRVVNALHVGYVSLAGRKEDILRALPRVLPVLRKHEIEELLISIQVCTSLEKRCTGEENPDNELTFNLYNQASKQRLGMFLDAA